MKGTLVTSLLLLLGAPLVGSAERLIPAGSLISCTMSEPRFSSKTANIGDPVLCQVSHVELYGRSTLPYGSYMVGRFEDYKDPGHFVGKGWMELRFDRMVIQPDTVIPISARVVNVPGYSVDREGRIQGKGHPVRDIVEWSIPILWPIDLINLPRRGPRPTLKGETRLTLKVMDDLGVPENQNPQPQQDGSGLWRRPSAYDAPPQPEPQPQPISQAAPQPAPQVQQVQVQPVQVQPVYLQPVQVQPVYVQAPQPVYYQQYVYVTPPPPPVRMYYGPQVVYRRPAPYWGAPPPY
jgi:hypothetical protein